MSRLNNSRLESSRLESSRIQAITLKRNKFGNYEHKETRFVVDKNTRCVYGKQNDNGSVDSLTPDDLKVCVEKNFRVEPRLLVHERKESEEKTTSSSESAPTDINRDTKDSEIDRNNVCECGDEECDGDCVDDDDECPHCCDGCGRINDESENEVRINRRIPIVDKSTEDKKETQNEESQEKIKENERKELLIELFVTKWQKKFDEKFADKKFNNNHTVIKFDVDRCSITNTHGLEFRGCELWYNKSTNFYYIEFNLYKFVDGICPPNFKGSEMYCVISFGSTLKEAFIKSIDNIDKHVFCRHCGNITKTDSYFFEQERCESCLITELITSKREKSEFCSICQEYTKNYYTIRCDHKFHRACLSRLDVKKCPTCRKWIDEDDEENYGDSDEE